MNYDLFDPQPPEEPHTETICEDAVVLRQFATAQASELIDALREVVRQSPFRQVTTPGGKPMSVGLTACGDHGWQRGQHDIW